MARKDSTVADLDELHRQARTARARLEPTWFMNLAYFMNEQWLSWDGRQLYRPQLRRSRITVVDNRINGVVRTEIARMTRQRPVFTCTPRTGDEEDANAAELAEQLVRYLWKHLKLESKVAEALLWSRVCAAGFLKAFWDPSLGPPVEYLFGGDGQLVSHPQTGAPLRANDPMAQLALATGDGNVRVKRIAQGDVRVEVRSPFQMGVDPLTDNFDEAEWCVEESVKSEDYVKQRYNVDIAADTPANPGLIEARMGQVLIPGTGSYKGVKIREYWSRPSSTHPNGRRAVWAPEQGKKQQGGQLLFEDDKPFDPMPYVMLSGIPVPGRLWPTCVTELLRGPQTELNKVKSQIAENRNRIGNPTILASRQAIQDPEKFIDATTIPGGVHFFDDIGSPNAVPKYLEAPQLPPYVVEEIDRIQQSIQEISGQHEVSSAQVPPGVTAASAINLLQEADDTRLGPAIFDYEYQLGKLGTKCLKLVAHYYTDQRTIEIGGDKGAWQFVDFKGAMLRENTRVEVQSGSMLPQSKAARTAALTDILRMLAQMGVPLQGQQLSQFLEDYQIGGDMRFLAGYSASENAANRENALMAQGQVVNINSFDDDEVHVDVHEDFQRQPRYQSLPPQIQQMFELHVGAHRERLSQMQQAQLEQQARMQGQVPPNLTEAALQDQHELSQLQGHAQMQMDMSGAAQQQGFDAAGAEQKQRQAEEEHRTRMQREAELHQQKMHQADELHQARLRQMTQPRPQGGQSNGRRNAA